MDLLCYTSDINKELFYFALSVMKNASQAEDAVSAGVLKAYEQIGSLRKNSSFKSWLFQITANECRKMLRKHSLFPGGCIP